MVIREALRLNEIAIAKDEEAEVDREIDVDDPGKNCKIQLHQIKIKLKTISNFIVRRSRDRRRSSRDRDRRRSTSRDRHRDRDRGKDKEKERERKRKGLPDIKKEHLSGKDKIAVFHALHSNKLKKPLILII